MYTRLMYKVHVHVCYTHCSAEYIPNGSIRDMANCVVEPMYVYMCMYTRLMYKVHVHVHVCYTHCSAEYIPSGSIRDMANCVVHL